MTAETANLDALTGPSAIPDDSERLEYGTSIVRNAEIWPVEVVVRPGWLPLWVQIEAVVRWLFTDVWTGNEGGSDDRDAVGKGDAVTVPMHLEELMVMATALALGRFRFLVPVRAALSAEHDPPLFDHV
jgi:hypothetical protein